MLAFFMRSHFLFKSLILIVLYFPFSGYMSPEYAMSGIVWTKIDVFSFGVLVLEIVSGKKNNSCYHSERPLNLIGYVSITIQSNLFGWPVQSDLQRVLQNYWYFSLILLLAFRYQFKFLGQIILLTCYQDLLKLVFISLLDCYLLA